MIIKDSKYLDNRYSPDTLMFREEQITKIMYELNSFKEKSGNLDITGQTGTGKTITILKCISMINFSDFNPIVYTNCRDNPTSTKAFVDIVRKLTGDSNISHFTAMNKYDMVIQCKRPIIILDEIDILLDNDNDNILYWLSNRDVSIICISNRPNWRSLISDGRINSRMFPNNLLFPLYNIPQIYTILNMRIKDALFENTIEPETVQKIAVLTSNEKADIRVSIGLLYSAAKTAELNNKNIITIEDVLSCFSKIKEDNSVSGFLDDLLPSKQLILFFIYHYYKKRNAYPCVNEITDIFNNTVKGSKHLKEVSFNTVRTYLTQLKTYGLVENMCNTKNKAGRGRYDTLWRISVNEDLFEKEIYNKFKELQK